MDKHIVYRNTFEAWLDSPAGWIASAVFLLVLGILVLWLKRGDK